MRFLEIVAASATTLSSPFDGLSRNVEKDFLRKVKFFEEGKSFCFVKKSLEGNALVKWLWEETRVPKVVGSNHCADITFFHIFLL